jgi:hypothetical protein
MRGNCSFKVKGKLAPKYVGLFKVIDRKGEVAYQLELPLQLTDVHNVFHVSQLKKCLRVPEEQLPLEELDLSGDLTNNKRPVNILDTAERMCKVQWSHHTEDEPPGSMKKSSDQIILNIPEHFMNPVGKIPLRG